MTTTTTTTSLRKEMKRMKKDGLCRASIYNFGLKRTKLSSELSEWGSAVVRHCGIDHFVEKRFCSGERGHPFDHSYWWSYYFKGSQLHATPVSDLVEGNDYALHRIDLDHQATMRLNVLLLWFSIYHTYTQCFLSDCRIIMAIPSGIMLVWVSPKIKLYLRPY